MKPVRVAHLVSHPIQYFAPLYREISRREEVDLTVYFYSDASLREYHDEGFGRPVRWDVDLSGGYRSVIVGSARGRTLSGRARRVPQWDVVREVFRGDYEVVWAHGYAYATTWASFVAARATGKAFLLREEQTLLPDRPWWKKALKYPVLRALIGGSAALTIGEHNRRYVEHYGAVRTFAAPYCVDNDALRRAGAELAPRRDEIRHELGVVGDDPVVLFAGKLVPAKDPQTLLEAYVQVKDRAWLVFVGDGELRAGLTREASNRGLDRVLFTGFLNQSELPRAYAASDVFVLPSRAEPWGLVVNEALNFRLPVIVSDAVGCAPDLAVAGRNGEVFSAGSVSDLGIALQRLVGDPGLRREYGRRGFKLVSEYGIEHCAEGIVNACLAVTGRIGTPDQARAA
jgi:glycosyltransferase involved in cell wall biosynthesis